MTLEAKGPRAGLGAFLRSHRDEIVSLWMKRVQEIFPARSLSAPLLVDHVPIILDFLADSVSVPAGTPLPGDYGKKSHAVERLARGYDLEDVIREYTLLRQSILDLWEREAGAQVELTELRRLQDAIEQSISESAARYAQQRERVLKALDRLSEVAFDAADDLERLFELLLHTALEAMEAVDTVVILLRDGDVLRVRAAAGLDEAASRYSIKIGEGFAGKIAAEAQPLCVASTEEPLVSGPMRGQGIRALYGVPLTSNGKVIGVAHMGSRTGYEFAADDKLLFDTLARRAAMVIQNALLAARERAYSAAARAFGRAASLNEAVVVLLPELGATLGWDVGIFWRVDAETQHLELVRFWRAASIEASEFERASRGAALSRGRGLPGKAWEAGGPVYVAEFAEAEHFPRSSAARMQGLRTALAFPIKVEDAVVGVVELLSRSMRWSSDEGVHLTTLIAEQLGQFTRRIAAQEELRKSSAQNAAILDAALDCVIAMDAGGRVAGWNNSAEQTFGYSRAEAMGRDMADLIIPPRLRAAHRLGLARYLATGQQQLIDRRVEVNAIRRDGSEFPIELAISRVQGEEPQLFTGFIRDISKNKEAERERTRLLEEVTRSRDAQRFLSDSSKELAATLEYKTTLAKVARLAVPGIADWCAVDVVEDGKLRRVSVAHVDPAKVELVRDIVRRYPPDGSSPQGPHEVVRTGRSILVSEIPDDLLVRNAQSPEHLQLIR
ncbi:MAG TPA: GAF domain-containing protein, partial [Gammaproteobacteria bacterium]|nr:GAF domain-containing protein [Gammaproteobacteria bacterium]